MEIIFNYFWFFCALVGVINFIIIKIKARRHEYEDMEELNRILNGMLILLTIPFILVGVFQNLGGYENIMYVYSGDYNNVFVLLSWAAIIFSSLYVMLWVVFMGGAEKLQKYSYVLSTRSSIKSVALTKVVYVVMFISVLLSIYMGTRYHIYDEFKQVTNSINR